MGFRKILITWVSEGIGDHHRLHSLDYQSGETFARTHGNFADGLRVQSHSRVQGQTVLFAIENIDRADFGLHPVGDGGDDSIERLLQIVRVADQRADILENIEMRRRSNAPIAFGLQFGHGKTESFIKHKFQYFTREQIRRKGVSLRKDLSLTSR